MSADLSLRRWMTPVAEAFRNADSGCLLWMKGATAQGRYGAIRHGDGVIMTHRAAWICRHGSIPSGLQVCHKCDVGFCINPDHLFLGTHDDNMADKTRKGRAFPA